MPKFRILAGKYHEDRRFWTSGQVFETSTNPLKLNTPGMKRFERVDDTTTVDPGTLYADEVTRQSVEAGVADTPAAKASVADTLAEMTVQELRTFAASEEIDLGSAKTKEQILDIIRVNT